MEGTSCDFFSLGYFIFTLPVLIIGLYRFVGEYQNWQKARQIKQEFLDDLTELELKRDRLKFRVQNLESGRTPPRAARTTIRFYQSW